MAAFLISYHILKVFSVFRCLHEETVISCDCMTAFQLQLVVIRRRGSVRQAVLQKVPELHCLKCRKLVSTVKLLHEIPVVWAAMSVNKPL